MHDSPHSIALGVTIGISVALSPTIPFHMIQAFFFAWLLKANKTAAVLSVWVSNPFTDLPMFFSEYLTGAYLLNYPIIDQETFGDYVDLVMSFTLSEPINLWHQIVSLIKLTWQQIGVPMFLGSLIWSSILGPLFYLITFKIIIKRRLAKQKRQLKFKENNNNPTNDI